MKINRLTYMAIVSLVAMGACKPEVTPGQAPGGANNDAGVTEASAFDSVISSDNKMLTVKNARIDLCSNPEGIVSSEVEWNASSVGTEGTQVWLKEAGKDAVLWSEAGAVEKSTTGKWLRDGTEVILKNGENKQELARVKVTAVPCD